MKATTKRPAKRTAKRLPRKGKPTPAPVREWPRAGVATVDEACQFLRFSRAALYRIVGAGLLTPIRYEQPKRATRLDWEELWRFALGKPAPASAS